MRRLLSLLGCLLISACSSTALDPRYRADSLVFDDGLVGRWKSMEDGKEAGWFEFIEKRRPLTSDGHVETFWPDGTRSEELVAGADGEPVRRPAETARIYEVVFNPLGKEGGALPFNGYLTEIGGQRYLGMQVSFLELAKSPIPYPYVLPTHTYWRIERTGDTLAMAFPRQPAVLVPGAVNSTVGSRANCKPAKPDAADGLLVFTSLEDLREHYRRHAETAGFFDPAGKLVRER